jgi:hypothetical protein
MKTTALVAIIGVVAVLGLAGAVLAAGPLSNSTGGSGPTGGMGSGQMGGMGSMYGPQYHGGDGDCPMDNDWNYSWNGSAQHGYCPCMG